MTGAHLRGVWANNFTEGDRYRSRVRNDHDLKRVLSDRTLITIEIVFRRDRQLNCSRAFGSYIRNFVAVDLVAYVSKIAARRGSAFEFVP